MSGEPILGKAHAEPHRDYKTLTWARFRRLRAWAQRVADHEGASVYLVGSALTKTVPRDLDVSIILPHDRFVAQFGTIPREDPDGVEHWDDPRSMANYMQRLHIYLFRDQPYWKWMIDDGLYMKFTRIDLKICPDSWWPEKDKLLLAVPRERGKVTPCSSTSHH